MSFLPVIRQHIELPAVYASFIASVKIYTSRRLTRMNKVLSTIHVSRVSEDCNALQSLTARDSNHELQVYRSLKLKDSLRTLKATTSLLTSALTYTKPYCSSVPHTLAWDSPKLIFTCQTNCVFAQQLLPLVCNAHAPWYYVFHRFLKF